MPAVTVAGVVGVVGVVGVAGVVGMVAVRLVLRVAELSHVADYIPPRGIRPLPPLPLQGRLLAPEIPTQRRLEPYIPGSNPR
jgi:hypothetical protein